MSIRGILDQIQQAGSKNGNKIKYIYQHMLGTQTRVEWKSLMLNNTPRPKAYFIMWLILHKKLATADRLKKWGLIISKTCTLCDKENETIEHLIIQCQFSCEL